MYIVFGSRSFRLRKFSIEELGLPESENFDVSVEVRQAYFHFCYIPFFSLGKFYAIRENNKLHDVPEHLRPYVTAVASKIKTPWYTYLGAILVLIGFICYKVDVANTEKEMHERDLANFYARKTSLDDKLTHLTTRDIITLKQHVGYSEDPLCLKVEGVKGDSVLIIPFQSSSEKPVEIERQYYKSVDTAHSMKISCKQLIATYPHAETNMHHSIGINLGNGNTYFVEDVVRHFGPLIEDAHEFTYGSNISLRFYNYGYPAVITEIKTLQGTIDWSPSIGKTVPEDQHGDKYYPVFNLQGKNYMAKDSLRFIMTLKDTTGQITKYEIGGTRVNKTIRVVL